MTDFHAAPDSWLRKQLKWAVMFQRGHDLPDDAREEGPVPVYAGGGITGWHKESCATPPGIVTGRYGTIGEFHLVSMPYWPLNTALYSIDLHDNDPEYLRYLLEHLAPLFHVHAGKSAVPGVDRNDVHTIPVALPGREQQRRIAAFLGREARRIDGLLTTKLRVLDLLAEKRKAIIATSVTRGLDPKVKLRDSGVPWLGEIPAHWHLVPLRHLLSLGPKNGISPPQAGSDGVLSFSISAVRDGRVTIEGNEKLVVLERSLARGYYVEPGDLLLVRGNGNLSLVGTCGLVDTAPDECTYPDILMLMRVNDGVAAEFLVAALNSPYVRAQVESLAQTTNGTYKLSGEDVRTLCVIVPPDGEQHAIVEHITREAAKLDAVRAATERTIALLKERRAALIAAAVTGQIDVGPAA